MRRRLLPESAGHDASLVLWARSLRAFGDGLVSLAMPVYLSLLGFTPFQIGLVATSTLLGSSLLTLGVGFAARHFAERSLLMAAACLMALSGLAFPLVEQFGPILLIAFLGTLSPSAGEASVFLPLEQTRLSHSIANEHRTSLFARYALCGTLAGAAGALAISLPDLLRDADIMGLRTALRGCFILYAVIGVVLFVLYARLGSRGGQQPAVAQGRLGQSRGLIFRLAALFSLDAFAGGFVVQSLLALWLFQRFELSLPVAAQLFFWAGILSAASYLAAPWLARRFGLIRTMVFTHLPANVCLVAIPFVSSLPLVIALLLVRAFLSQMDVPTRSSYVMAVVAPGERAVAASLTAVARTFASSLSPGLAGLLLSTSSFGWPLVVGGGLKIAYDLALLRSFNHVKPPEELPPDPKPQVAA